MAFELDERLRAGSIELGRLGICRVLLKDNAHYFWFILVPELEGAEELHALDATSYAEVSFAMRGLAAWVAETFQPDKLNVAAIGNKVRQLHVHVVGRHEGDAAWPGTVWDCPAQKPFSPEEIALVERRFLEWQRQNG